MRLEVEWSWRRWRHFRFTRFRHIAPGWTLRLGIVIVDWYSEKVFKGP